MGMRPSAENDSIRELMGCYGFDYITDTAAHTPVPINGTPIAYKCIHFLTATVISAVVADATAPMGGTTVAGVTFAAGSVIYGKFTSLTLTSGTLIAYNGAL